ncbi:hypothetical protein OH76DRAFT_1412800 [Lentinus brumalis]|uniref:Uncharacterized protein n=1 Tax=Lentinus brumalis TaxID=2498619 RepID=A0A371CKA9_9APHY|nr:hypothetical protein OH76DRAFT_1412800 [Polyporus brumalis]
MPEVDCIEGLVYDIGQAQARGTLLRGSIVIFPRVFAEGTDRKPYTSCTVLNLGYNHWLEPPPSAYEICPRDERRSRKQPWEDYLKPWEEGAVHVVARGKELLVAAGYHALRINLGLEAFGCIIPRDAFDSIVAEDVPGTNKDKAKAERLRSFVIPSQLVVPEARRHKKRADGSQLINIFAAVVCEKEVFLVSDFARLVRITIISIPRHWEERDLRPGSLLWPQIWDKEHGPDWLREPEAAAASVLEWRAQILHKNDLGTSLLKELCLNQVYFNGLGKHTATDFLFSLGLWPGTPPVLICQDDTTFQSFVIALRHYMELWVSDAFRRECLSSPNLQSPFAFNHWADLRYTRRYLWVYRKAEVKMPVEQYNMYARLGLLDKEHIIGGAYVPNYGQLAHGTLCKRGVPVHVYIDPHGTAKKPYKVYTIVLAKRPDDWGFAWNESRPVPADDVRLAGMATTIGPASFHMFKQNQHDRRLPGLPGKIPKEKRAGPGRPAKRRPNRAARDHQQRAVNNLRKRIEARTGETSRRAAESEAESTSDGDSEVDEEERPSKRPKFEGRVTRSRAKQAQIAAGKCP